MSLGLEFSRKICLSLIIFIILSYDQSVISSNLEEKKKDSETKDAIPSECINIPDDLCPSQESDCLCLSLSISNNLTEDNLISNNKVSSVLCCHLSDVEQLRSSIQCATSEDKILALHIRNSSVGSASLSLASKKLFSLSSLAITDGMPPNITRHLSEIAPNISCLNLSSNGMSDLPEDALKDLHFLRALDLSANNVTRLPRLPNRPFWIDISGNQHLGCSGILAFISPNFSLSEDLESSYSSSLSASLPQKQPITFHNKRNTYCISPRGYDWFNWTERTPLVQLESLIELQKEAQKECPSGEKYTCYCSISRFDYIPVPSHSVTVDCSGQGLTELPLTLPQHTAILNVSNNHISSLERLGRNDYYKEIRKFYANNNLISSIEVLEGSDFLINFEDFFLSGNKLKELPMYILHGFFENSNRVRFLTLGSNDYTCNCHTYQDLKIWLIQNKKYILDHDNIFCASQDPPVKITDLEKEKVCFHETDWLDYMYVVVVAEILLLVALVTKVTYDYWIFKTKGYLPWPASQTPKLPCCDWAFDA